MDQNHNTKFIKYQKTELRSISLVVLYWRPVSIISMERPCIMRKHRTGGQSVNVAGNADESISVQLVNQIGLDHEQQ